MAALASIILFKFSANNNKKLIKEVKALLGSWERKALAVKASTA